LKRGAFSHLKKIGRESHLRNKALIQRHAVVRDLNELFTAMTKQFREDDLSSEEYYSAERERHMGGLFGDDPDNQDVPESDDDPIIMPWNKRAWSHEAYTIGRGDFLGGLEFFANCTEEGDLLCERIFSRLPNTRDDPDYKERQREFGEKHGYWAEWLDDRF